MKEGARYEACLYTIPECCLGNGVFRRKCYVEDGLTQTEGAHMENGQIQTEGKSQKDKHEG